MYDTYVQAFKRIGTGTGTGTKKRIGTGTGTGTKSQNTYVCT